MDESKDQSVTNILKHPSPAIPEDESPNKRPKIEEGTADSSSCDDAVTATVVTGPGSTIAPAAPAPAPVLSSDEKKDVPVDVTDAPTERMILFLTGKPSCERSRYAKAFKFPQKVRVVVCCVVLQRTAYSVPRPLMRWNASHSSYPSLLSR